MYETVGTVIIVISLMFILLVSSKRSVETDFMKGFWKASPEFCEESGLELFIMYIGDSNNISGTRPGYMVAQNGAGLILNHPVDLNFSWGNSLKPGICECRQYSLYIDWLEGEKPDCFSSSQSVYYYPEAGKLVLLNNDEVSVVLYKDHYASDIANRMPEQAIEIEDEGSESI